MVVDSTHRHRLAIQRQRHALTEPGGSAGSETAGDRAAGEVIRFDDHTPFTYGKDGFENPFFIAYAPGVLLAK